MPNACKFRRRIEFFQSSGDSPIPMRAVRDSFEGIGDVKRNNRKHTDRANNSSLSQLQGEPEKGRRKQSMKERLGATTGAERDGARGERGKQAKTVTQRTRSCGKHCSLSQKTNCGAVRPARACQPAWQKYRKRRAVACTRPRRRIISIALALDGNSR